MAAVELRATNTHLYPGAWLASPAARPLARGDAVSVLFVDGATTAGRISAAHGGDLQLDTKPYRTQRGTQIPAKAWRLREVPAPDAGPARKAPKPAAAATAIHYRVAGRASPPR